VLAAGLGAGFAYWAIAGWNAGITKPARAAATTAAGKA
jgi:choline-glycine betaine transporter